MDIELQSFIFDSILETTTSILNSSNITTMKKGVVTSLENDDGKGNVLIGEDLFSCIIPSSLKSYIYNGDIVLVEEVKNSKDRFVIGCISRDGNSSNIHIFDTVSQTIISTLLSVVDDNGRQLTTLLEIYSEE